MDIYTSVYDLDRNNPAIMVMLGLFVASLITSANGSVLVFLGRTGPKHRALQVCAGVSTLLFAVGFGAAIHVVHEARQAFLDSYLTDKGTGWFESINRIEPVLSVVGWAMGLFSALSALTIVLFIRRSPEFRAQMPIGLFFTCFLLCVVTALGIALRLSFIGSAPPITALMDPEVHWAIQHGDQVLTVARWSILCLAVFATIVMSVQAFRNQSIPQDSFGSHLWILGIFFAAIGTHTWLTTRPFALDARNPLPPPREGPIALCPDTSFALAKLPRAMINDDSCYHHDFQERRLGVVELEKTGAKLNGEAVSTPEQLGQMLRNRFESQSTFHYRHVIVAADATMPDSEFSQWLASMPPQISVTRLLGHDEPARQSTHTTGVVARKPRCACRPVERPFTQAPPHASATPSAPAQ